MPFLRAYDGFLRRPQPRHPMVLLQRAMAVVVGGGLLVGREAFGATTGVVAGLALLSAVRVPSRRLVLETLLLGIVVALGAGASSASWLAFPGGLVVLGVAAWCCAPEDGTLPLNGLDRYFVVQDYPGVPMNSHPTVDLGREPAWESLVAALDVLVKETPLLRSFVRVPPWGAERFYAERPWFPIEALVVDGRHWGPDQLAANLDEPLDLERMPPLRLVVARSREGWTRIVLTQHHSTADGSANLALLNRFFEIWGAQAQRRDPGPSPFPKVSPRLREIFWPRGLPWVCQMVLRHVRPGAKVGVIHAAMQDGIEDGEASPLSRTTREQSWDVPSDVWGKLKLVADARQRTRNDLLVHAALAAADRWRRARSLPDRDFRMLLPMDLRPLLGLQGALQNYAGSLDVAFGVEEMRQSSFPETLSKRIRDGRRLEEAIEAPVNLGFLSSFLPFAVFRKALQDFDRDPRSFYFSMLFSHMRLHAELAIPSDLELRRFFVRGSLTKTPGFGVVVTTLPGHVHVLVEYLSPMLSEQGAADYMAEFQRQIRELVAEVGIEGVPHPSRARDAFPYSQTAG